MPGDLGVPAAFGGVVAERGDVGKLGLELGDELGGGDVVVALLADVGVGAGFGGELAGSVAVRDPGLEHLGAQPFDPDGVAANAISDTAETATRRRRQKRRATRNPHRPRRRTNESLSRRPKRPGGASVADGIDRAYFNQESRFGGAFYASSDPETALAKLASHGNPAGYGIRFAFKSGAANILDLTNPDVAASYGY